MRVTYQRELQAQELFSSLNIRSYVPMKIVYNGAKQAPEAALHNYIFVYSSFNRLYEIKTYQMTYLRYTMTPCESGQPEPMTVPEYQMINFMKIVETRNNAVKFFNPEELPLQNKKRVRVMDGEFQGVEGIYVKRRVVVSLSTIIGVATDIIPKKNLTDC